MLSRAALPLLRQRTLRVPVRLALAQPHFRPYARKHEPLRPVKPSPNERISPQPIERSYSIPEPGEAPRSAGRPSESPRPRVEQSSSPTNNTEQRQRTAPQEKTTPQIETDAEPTGPLPDLTKGIPSTLEAELNQARKAQEDARDDFNITEDPRSPPPSGGGRSTDGLPRSEYVSSSDRKRSAVVKYVYSGIFLGLFGYLLYTGRNWDNTEEARQHPEAPNGWSPGRVYDRIRARFGTTMSYYSDPVTTKLLPDEEADPNLRAPFVLVLSLEDLLVHAEWSRATGWRMAKRPGVDYFLRYLSQYYELVLFTTQPYYIADQILRKLDPYSIIRWPLFREHTLYKDGGYVKDLSYLNRDLKKVIIMDTNSHHVMNQPENAIVIPKWTGDPADQTLIQFIPFLEYLATMGFDDARTVLKSFEGKYIPVEFAEREKTLRKRLEAKNADKRKSKSGGFGMGSLFGTRQQPQDGVQSLGSAQAEDKMIWDQIREQGQKNYEAFEKRIRDEGAKWLAEREAEEKRLQEEAMSSMKSGMFGWFGSSKPADK